MQSYPNPQNFGKGCPQFWVWGILGSTTLATTPPRACSSNLGPLPRHVGLLWALLGLPTPSGHAPKHEKPSPKASNHQHLAPPSPCGSTKPSSFWWQLRQCASLMRSYKSASSLASTHHSQARCFAPTSQGHPPTLVFASPCPSLSSKNSVLAAMFQGKLCGEGCKSLLERRLHTTRNTSLQSASYVQDAPETARLSLFLCAASSRRCCHVKLR